mmetsp:Transcript_43911/g.117242  ORF Transcript_43911/g.117242 Transcript_43911/m.117242 type:complete len:80 (-) Transcript_43911:170-409(-)
MTATADAVSPFSSCLLDDVTLPRFARVKTMHSSGVCDRPMILFSRTSECLLQRDAVRNMDRRELHGNRVRVELSNGGRG